MPMFFPNKYNRNYAIDTIQAPPSVPLHPRILLMIRTARVPRIPLLALVLTLAAPRAHAGTRLHDAGILQDGDPEALARVPRDVAVQQPDARVVERDGDDHVSVGRQDGRVAARRVLGLPARGGAVPGGVCAGLEEEEVVAVEVDGVGDARDGGEFVDGDDGPFVVLVRRRRRGFRLASGGRRGVGVCGLGREYSQQDGKKEGGRGIRTIWKTLFERGTLSSVSATTSLIAGWLQFVHTNPPSALLKLQRRNLPW